jgi:hypothetical protein
LSGQHKKQYRPSKEKIAAMQREQDKFPVPEAARQEQGQQAVHLWPAAIFPG